VGLRPHGCSTGWSAIGLNPISNIVDMTNLLLSELPQPTHAFDADKLSAIPFSSAPPAPASVSAP
jgi:phenylalanyl-tRNA synthetase beta subunit